MYIPTRYSGQTGAYTARRGPSIRPHIGLGRTIRMLIAAMLLLITGPVSTYASILPVSGSSAPQSQGPRVLGITPGVGVLPGEIEGAAPVAVTFSEAMDRKSAQAAFSLQPTVQGSFAWQQNTLIFTPARALLPRTQYRASVSAQAKSASGRSLSAPASISFGTAAPPTILRTLPSPNASEVPTDTVLTLSFDRPMIPVTALSNQPDASDWVQISPHVPGRWVWLGTAAAGFQADAGLQPSTTYRVAVKAGWPDAAGVPLAQGSAFQFTTVRPSLLAVSPQNQQDRVAIDPPVVVHFNQAMNTSSVESSFYLHETGTGDALKGRYSWSPDTTVMTFTAASLLHFSASYTAEFRGKVRPADGDLSDLATGQAANSWTFNTVGPTVVTSHDPDNSKGPAPPSDLFAFYLSNPIAPGQDVAHFVTVDPVPQGYLGSLHSSDDYGGGTVVSTNTVKLLPNTVYHFQLKAGLKDVWGFPVEPASWQVEIGPPVPSLNVKGDFFIPVNANGPSRVQIEATNLTTVTLGLSPLNEQSLRARVVHPAPADPSPNNPPDVRRDWVVPIPPSQDGTSAIFPTLSLDENLDHLAPGYYALTAVAPSPYENAARDNAVLIVGRAGAVLKSEGQNLLVWVTDLSTGKPLADYPLRIEQLQSAKQPIVQRGRTNSDGVLRTTLIDVEGYRDAVTVWGEQPGDALFAATYWSQGITPSDLDTSSDYGYVNRGSSTEQAAVYTDRPIYRPGQTVYFRGVKRKDDDATYTVPPAGTTVQLAADNRCTATARGAKQVYTGTLSLSPIGTFHGQFTLPLDAATGEYKLRLDARDDSYVSCYDYDNALANTAPFRVEEYRKPDFQVSVDAKSSVLIGDPVTATVHAGYYFGGPLVNVTTTVTIKSEPYYPSWSDPDTGEQYTFWAGDPGTDDSPDTGADYSTIEARTDKEGLLTIDLTPYIEPGKGSRQLTVEGEVLDLNNQAVANSTQMVVHQSLYYVGLHTSSYVVQADEPVTVTVRSIDADGKHLHSGANVQLDVTRVEWTQPSPDNGNQWTRRDTPVASAIVTTDASGRATYAFSRSEAGDYEITARSTDSRGNKTSSVTSVWIVGNTSTYSHYVPWHNAGDRAIKLVADKGLYRVGDTARILVTSPFTQATGLLTVERGHVKRYSIVTLEGSTPVVDVPLEAGDLPNVYVSLTLIGQEPTTQAAPPDWSQVGLRQGYANLHLDTSGKDLKVSIEPQKGPFAPGSTLKVVVHIQDSTGKPVAAELSLAAIDEAIFALVGGKVPDLFKAFWRERGLDVRTATSFTSGDETSDNTRKGMPSTGGGGVPESLPLVGAPVPGPGQAENGAPSRIRTDFRDTAFWRADVSTGADGSALVAVPLPDNLTTWRFTSQAISQDTRFGIASTPITTTQPLLLRPVQPRFLTTGDSPGLQAIVHNNTASALDLEASLVVSGALTLAPRQLSVQRLTVAPNAQAVVTWNAKVGQGETANLRYWVHTLESTGQAYLEDAAVFNLRVQAFAAPEVVATSGEVVGTQATENILLPYTVSPALGDLVVQVSPSLAAATTDGVNYVKLYGYECSEQTTSRYLPLVVLDQVYKAQGRRTQFSAETPTIVQHAFARLAELQHGDGGWSWWSDGPSQWWQTAYVVQGLTAARDAGYRVPSDMLHGGIERLRGFQSDNATAGIDETYHLNMRAYSLYVLANSLAVDSALKQEATNLLGQTPRMSVHARAWLAMALGKLGMAAESKKVLDSLIPAARQSSTTAHWEEINPDYQSMSTDARATALALDAMVTLDPNNPLIPKAVRWLITQQRDGHWLSTQETSITLIALAHYIAQSKELTADYEWQVSAFGKQIGNGVANAQTLTQTTTLKLPVSQMPQNTTGSLVFSRSQPKGKMYYHASLRYYVPGDNIQARSEGIAVTRTYLKVDETAGTAPIHEAKAGELVKMRLTIAVPDSSYYVMVTDPLPAGMESVNGSLHTTSFTELPSNPRGSKIGEEEQNSLYRWWGPFDNVEMRDDRTVLFAEYLLPGTYVYDYFARATTPGTYMALPTHAEMMYFPDVFGRSEGGVFTVR